VVGGGRLPAKPFYRKGDHVMSFRNGALPLSVVVLLLNLTVGWGYGQMAGSRAGADFFGGDSSKVAETPRLSLEMARGAITIEGSSEVRVTPSELRMVLAVIREAETAMECRSQTDQIMQAMTADWTKMGLEPADIVADFIAVLPRHEFQIDRQTAVETKTGYLMQTNVHLRLSDDQQALQAMHIAFQHNVTDVLAFDYMSDQLETAKQQAIGLAVKAARDKAQLLFAGLFDQPPRLINLTEDTQIHYPATQYQSFTNVADDAFSQRSFRSDIGVIRLFRPRNTYYRGILPQSDVFPPELPLSPRISIRSRVHLYFESPASVSETADPAQPK